jgi:hypothetical protein
VRKFVAQVATLTLAAAGTLAVAGPAAAQEHRSEHASHATTVLVHGDGTNVTLSRAMVKEGRISFKVDSTNTTPGAGSQITLFRLVGHTSLVKFKADLAHEFSSDLMTAAKGTRELNRDIRSFGLADVIPGFPAVVTEQLTAGHYYLMDLGSNQGVPDPAFTTFTVYHSGRGVSGGREDRRDGPVVKLTSADRFISPRTLPAQGTVTVKNVADTIHFMSIDPVKPGTTDKQIQAYFDSGSQSPPPFAVDGPSVGMDVLSPGRQLQLTYKLPPGTYVLFCFVADDVTGMPHAIMGMHKVVILK